MFLNKFSARIPQGQEDHSGYVILPHNTKYSLVLKNGGWYPCDARVEIDGKHQGTWRIEECSSIILERPAHDDGHFTFYKTDSEEGRAIGLSKLDPNTGLIKITFTPGDYPQPKHNLEVLRSFSKSGMQAGGTGLSGTSSQRFGDATEIELDYSRQTVIHLRLVASEMKEEPRPLTTFSNPVPPAV